MRLERWIAAAAAGAALAGTASAEPIDTWQVRYPDYECLTGRLPDPPAGTAEFEAREDENIACHEQRNHDRRPHTLQLDSSLSYGQDPYRQPERFAAGLAPTRWRFSEPAIDGVASAELFLPCSNTPGECPDLAPGLQRFDPPYPAVQIHHGAIAQKEHHRYTSQWLAEHGYAALAINGTLPVGGGPNVPISYDDANAALEWLRSQPFVEVNRIGFAGHSAGAGTILQFQEDPRISAMIVWDSQSGGPQTANNKIPTIFMQAEGGFSSPARHDAYQDLMERGDDFAALRSRGVDTMTFTIRATTHVDYNGNGVTLGYGNRYAEQTINYFSTAWMDRHLKGKLVLSGDETLAQELAERALRQAIAEDAYERLIATHFDDSVDFHNISMGQWDPEQAAATLDPLYGGNVPYSLAGTEIGWRYSFYYRHGCYVSVPDYVNGGDGSPGGIHRRRADTSTDGDMRIGGGCPEIFRDGIELPDPLGGL